jgi:hypothetical protein
VLKIDLKTVIQNNIEVIFMWKVGWGVGVGEGEIPELEKVQ